MGQGQADVALATLRECSRNGDWLCLKNLHLVTAWLPLLEKVGALCVEEFLYVRRRLMCVCMCFGDILEVWGVFCDSCCSSHI